MNPDLVDFLAPLENVSWAELYAEVASFASVVDYKNVRISKLQSLRRLDGFSARFGGSPWPYCAHGVRPSRVLAEF